MSEAIELIWQHPCMPVNEVAQRGFGATAQIYERTRPSYPPDAVAWLTDELRIGPDATVCDLAAGTGKLTRLLVPTGAELIAVDPVEGMRAELRRVVPDVSVVAATAEHLPFTDESLDAVTVAQGFHWFDASRALPELQRVLRPGGRLGLIWNARDRTPDWADQAWAVLDRVERHAPWRDHDQSSAVKVFGNARDGAIGGGPWFHPLHEAHFHHTQPSTPDEFVDRLRAVSHVAVLPADEQAAVLDDVRHLLATHPDTTGRDQLDLPYRVDAYWCERQ